MNTDEIKTILAKHDAWLDSAPDGKRANLRGVNLGGVNLRGANLHGADMRGANLTGAECILSIGPGGSRGDMLYAVKHETCIMIYIGCFGDTLDVFAAAVEKTHGDDEHGKYYRAVIEMIKVWEILQVRECYRIITKFKVK